MRASTRSWSATSRPGTSSGPTATSRSRKTPTSSSCSASTSRTSFRPAPGTPSDWTPECRLEYGSEMMLEIARFWASMAHFNPERERYEIHGVMGPDEFHEKYPDSEKGGLRNNAYTNVMVAWISEISVQLLNMLPERRQKL